MKSESISAEKKRFCKSLTIITDTREQKNSHIISALDDMGIKHEERKLHFGDYSFICGDDDFTLSCIVERKANLNELWQNITADRARFEKEIAGIHALTGNAVLLIENCKSRDFLREYKVPAWEMNAYKRKVSDIGIRIDSTLRAWEATNRYRLQVHCLDGTDNTTTEILNVCYYYWKNFTEMKKPLK